MFLFAVLPACQPSFEDVRAFITKDCFFVISVKNCVFPMIFDGCGLPVWVPGPPWSHPWALDIANLGRFSKLTKLKQSDLSKN